MVMVRKQIYIEPEQDALLKRRAKELGITEAEVIRRGLKALESQEAGASSAPTRRRSGREIDPQAWAELETLWAKQRELAKTTPQQARTWTRDEIYDERFARFSR